MKRVISPNIETFVIEVKGVKLFAGDLSFSLCDRPSTHMGAPPPPSIEGNNNHITIEAASSLLLTFIMDRTLIDEPTNFIRDE